MNVPNAASSMAGQRGTTEQPTATGISKRSRTLDRTGLKRGVRDMKSHDYYIPSWVIKERIEFFKELNRLVPNPIPEYDFLIQQLNYILTTTEKKPLATI